MSHLGQLHCGCCFESLAVAGLWNCVGRNQVGDDRKRSCDRVKSGLFICEEKEE